MNRIPFITKICYFQFGVNIFFSCILSIFAYNHAFFVDWCFEFALYF